MSTPPLTFEALSAQMEDFRNRDYLSDKLVYAVHESVTPGKVLMMNESEYGYAVTLFHSEEEAQQIAAAAGLTLVRIQDAPRKPLYFAKRAFLMRPL